MRTFKRHIPIIDKKASKAKAKFNRLNFGALMRDQYGNFRLEARCLDCRKLWHPRLDALTLGYGCPECQGYSKPELQNLLKKIDSAH